MAGEYAGKQGVFLGIENHGGIVAEADSLLKIVEATKSKWVGINLDTGNFHTDDVYGDIARCVRYAVNVQLKVEIRPRGAKQKSPADIARLVGILRKGNSLALGRFILFRPTAAHAAIQPTHDQ